MHRVTWEPVGREIMPRDRHQSWKGDKFRVTMKYRPTPYLCCSFANHFDDSQSPILDIRSFAVYLKELNVKRKFGDCLPSDSGGIADTKSCRANKWFEVTRPGFYQQQTNCAHEQLFRAKPLSFDSRPSKKFRISCRISLGYIYTWQEVITGAWEGNGWRGLQKGGMKWISTHNHIIFWYFHLLP